MSPSQTDELLIRSLRVLALAAACIVAVIVLFLIWEAVPALRHIGPARLLGDDGWHPSEDSYGLLSMIAGSGLVTLGAILLAGPVGVLVAVFCRTCKHRTLAAIYRRMIELLAGIPSVVFGFWGLVVLVPAIARWHAPGASLLAGILIVAMMILPTVALLADTSIASIEREHTRTALALGLTQWTTTRRVLLPAARSGIIAGVFLATARAMGETMAVLMVCGNVVALPDSLFAPVRTLTANIALEMSYAMGDHRSALFVTGLVLLAAVAVLVMTAAWLSRARAGERR